MSFFKEQGRDFLSGWMGESFHSLHPALGDKELYMQTTRNGSAACEKQGPHIVCALAFIASFSDLIWSLTLRHRMAPDLLDLISDPRNIFTISTYFALEPPVMNIKI